jgi:hypothetical protein
MCLFIFLLFKVIIIDPQAILEEPPHFPEQLTLKRLRQNVCPHFTCRATSQIYIPHIIIVFDEKVFALICLVRFEHDTLPFHSNDNVLMLSWNMIHSSMLYHWHLTWCSVCHVGLWSWFQPNSLCYISVCWRDQNCSNSKRNQASHLSLTVIVYLMWSINLPMYSKVHGICTQDQFQISWAIYVF